MYNSFEIWILAVESLCVGLSRPGMGTCLLVGSAWQDSAWTQSLSVQMSFNSGCLLFWCLSGLGGCE